MDDITKISLGAAFGAFGGFLVTFSTEPIKTWLKNVNDRRRLRSLVYKDLMQIYTDMIWLKQQAGSGSEFSDENLRVATKRYDAAQHDLLLYTELREAVDVDVLHARLAAIAACPAANMSHRVKKLDSMIATFEDTLKRGRFSSRRATEA